MLTLAGHRHDRLAASIRRFSAGLRLLNFVAEADSRLVRSPRVLAGTIGLHATIVMLDVATVWVLIRALGTTASAGGVFASFMVASLFRTMGIVPGGLGTLEASSVLMLRMMGVDLAVALSATLLFRGLSFWLPMLPGYWFSRRAVAPRRIAPSKAGAKGEADAYRARATPEIFRTSWFVESLLTELVVALVMCTRRPFFRSRPGTLLLESTIALIVLALAIPYLPFADAFGFVPLPGGLLAAIAFITVLCVAATELQKQWFYRSS